MTNLPEKLRLKALAEEDIPMITPASTNEKVTERGLPYMFRMCGRDDDQAPAAAKFMKEALGAKTIFIVDDKTTYSQGLADGVSKACKELGIEVVEHDHVNQGDKDFAAVLTKAKQANADIFYMSLQGFSPAALMTLQAKRMGLESQIVTQDAVFQPKYMEVAKEAAEGVYLTYGFTDTSTPERTRKVPSRLSEKVNIASRVVQALNAPRFSVTASECISAVPTSQGMKEAFSTGSQNHQPPQPSS